MAITINLTNGSELTSAQGSVWVAGWINGGDASSFKALQSGGSFAPPVKATQLPFNAISDVTTITLDEATNGNNRLLFVVAPQQPDALSVSGAAPIGYAQYPYAAEPGSSVCPPGPFDVFEFGMDAAFNLTAVSGFGLNLRFSATDPASGTLYHYGVRETITRAQIATAYKAFIANEAASNTAAGDFAELLYTQPLPGTSYFPPKICGEFFALCDPNDMLAAKSGNYVNPTSDPLHTYWDQVLDSFFNEGNQISINLSANPTAPNIYSGSCAPATNPLTQYKTQAFQLSNGTQTVIIYKPEPGLQSVQYVFQQAFGELTPAGSAGDAGLVQDTIWEALCRGVALSGVQPADPPSVQKPGFSTTAWNQAETWYQAGCTCHVYAKFLHCSDADGGDSRITGKPPIFQGGQAYGFSMDESPLGPYSGPNVPSKTPFNISSGTVTLALGPWETQPHITPVPQQYSFAFGTGCGELAPVTVGGKVYPASDSGAIGGLLPDLPHWTKMEFGNGSGRYIWIKNGEVKGKDCFSKPVEEPTKTPNHFAWPADTNWKSGATPPPKP